MQDAILHFSLERAINVHHCLGRHAVRQNPDDPQCLIGMSGESIQQPLHVMQERSVTYDAQQAYLDGIEGRPVEQVHQNDVTELTQ